MIGAEDAVRVEVIDPLGRQMHELAPPARRAFLDLAIAAARIDHGLIRSIRAKSKRWPLRVAMAVPVVGRPVGIGGTRCLERRQRLLGQAGDPLRRSRRGPAR